MTMTQKRTGTRKESFVPAADTVLPEMETLGEEFSRFVRIEQTGGHCTEPDCENDAPFVILQGRVRVPLPCEEHTPVEDPEAELMEELAIGALASSGLTERMDGFTLDGYGLEFQDAEGVSALNFVLDWERDYLAGVRRNMVMWGPVGCGKTGLAAGLVRDLCERGVRARYVDFASLLEAMKDSYAHKQPVTNALAVGRVPVLVLDDLGSERATEWAHSQLLGIVNARYESQLPTIYISNYEPEDLAKIVGRFDEVVGKRIVSRMLEGASKFMFVRVDQRRRKKAA